MRNDGPIPCVEYYRGIGIHVDQPPARVEVVKAELDRVLEITDLRRLAEICPDVSWSPEARLLSSALIRARFELAVEAREARPPEIDLEYIDACIAGLDSVKWRSRTAYCSYLDSGPAPHGPFPVKRETPLDDE